MPRNTYVGYSLSRDAMAANAATFIFKALRRDSTDTGSVELTDIANAPASSKAEYGYQVPIGETTLVNRVIFDIVDSSVDPGDFGGVNNGLANGIKIMVVDSSNNTLCDFLDGDTIRRNHQFCWLAGNDVDHVESAKDDHLPIRWTLGKAGSLVRLNETEKFIIEVRDNLSMITSMRVFINGLQV